MASSGTRTQTSLVDGRYVQVVSRDMHLSHDGFCSLHCVRWNDLVPWSSLKMGGRGGGGVLRRRRKEETYFHSSLLTVCASAP